MNFSIPGKFYLGGSKIDVVFVEQVSGEGKDIDGMAMYSKSRIEIKNDKEYSDSYKEWVFFHELIHHVFNSIGEDEMKHNEKLVDQVALLLHQAFTTME